MKHCLTLFLLFASLSLSGQSKIDLRPQSMLNYIGISSQEQFEELVGQPYDDTGEELVYGVYNSYTDADTAIYCRYNNNILTSVRFATRYYLGYVTAFYFSIEGFPAKEETARRQGLFDLKKDGFDNWVSVRIKWKNLGMQMSNIDENLGTATVNYYHNKE